MKCVVADSGPLIALALLDSLHLPKVLWGQLLAPATVLEECTALRGITGVRLIELAVADGLIDEASDTVLENDIATLGLDLGESQALGLARRIQAGLLVDERRGRRAARVCF